MSTGRALPLAPPPLNPAAAASQVQTFYPNRKRYRRPASDMGPPGHPGRTDRRVGRGQAPQERRVSQDRLQPGAEPVDHRGGRR